MTTLIKLRNRLINDGWTVRHTSKRDGRITSIYLFPAGDPHGKDEIRVSDHELGTTVYGEAQGGRWAVDLVVDPDLSLDDHLRAIADEDYANDALGFCAGYSHAEYLEQQEEAAHA